MNEIEIIILQGFSVFEVCKLVIWSFTFPKADVNDKIGLIVMRTKDFISYKRQSFKTQMHCLIRMESNLYKEKGIYMYLSLLQIKEHCIQEIEPSDVADQMFPSTNENSKAQLKDFCSSNATPPWVT